MQRHWTYQLAVISCVFWLDFFMLFVNCNLLRIKSGISCHLSLRQDTKGWVHWAVWKSGWRPDHSKYSTCTDLVWWQSNSIKEVWQSKYPTAASSWTWKKKHDTSTPNHTEPQRVYHPHLNCNGSENPMKLPNSLKQNSDWSQILELW